MNELSLVSNDSKVNDNSRVASQEVGRHRYFKDGHVLLQSTYLYFLIKNHRVFTQAELRIFLASKAAKYKDVFYFERIYNYIDRHNWYPSKAKRAITKLAKTLKEADKSALENNYPMKLPRAVIKMLAKDGDRLEILLFLFGCSKQTCKSRMTFTLPQEFLAQKLGSSRGSVQRVIKKLVRRGLLIPIHTPSKELEECGQRYSWYCSNYLPELRRYLARKKMKVISSSVEPKPSLSPDRQYPSPAHSSVPDCSSAPLSLPR